MARPELGTKRTCPETGRKFYDLDRDPVVSPYTGIAYPRSAFEAVGTKGGRVAPVAEVEEDEEEVVEKADVELVSLEEAEGEEKKADGDEDIDLGDDEADDTFLAEEEEGDDDDVSGLIDSDIEDEEEG
ncbi:TIGR02300 family protein [Salinarimonas ramus]|uniref:TIGR02300 family protein n=1 Tax=Salinarimonas ramus TaxID=690164 RepID=A0A917V3P4_9HYPH|nr:TIGR02300 family protein [Salinarimonas ramus]GGK31836.1 TIGR02300 family protein [Salinarimonas ramus]